jgi:nucleotide-binding universal stress UspA family protein
MIRTDACPSTSSTRRRVVVGYDGLPASRAALERAVEAAGEDGVVFVVHAYARPHLDDAEAKIRVLWEETGGPLDRVAWEPEIIGGDPAQAIAAVAAARHADEIVVGSRSFGLTHGLRGSVANDLIRHADLPVTVIPHAA